MVHELAELAAAPVPIARGIPHVMVGFSGALSDELARLVLDSVAPLWALEGVRQTPRGFNGDMLLHSFPRSMATPQTDGPSLPIGPLPFGSATSDSQPDWVELFGADRPGIYVTFRTEMARATPRSCDFHGDGGSPGRRAGAGSNPRSYRDRLIDGSAKNSVTVVPVDRAMVIPLK